MNNIHAALEIGTSRTVLAIGEAQPGGRLKVSCPAIIPSSGIRKSQILDINQATASIRSVLHEAERRLSSQGDRIEIGNVFLTVSGQHIKAEPVCGSATVAGDRVTDHEIEEAERSARSRALPKDRELLDIVDQDYVLDSIGGISSPKGMSGRVLMLNTLHIHADANRLKDARAAADQARLEIRDPVFAATAAAETVLEDHEKRNGCLVLDLGAGTTGYAAYVDGRLATAGVLGVGGDHVTNDIALAFQTTQNQAEEIKIAEASATIGDRADTPRVKLPGDSPLMEARTISRAALNTVVNARMTELCEILSQTLDENGVLHRLHSGVVLTGGGASMRGFPTLLQHCFNLPVRTGTPIHVDGLSQEPNPERFAAIAGTLLFAHRNYEEKSFLNDILKGFFK